jgi:hypothetical protein
MHEIVPQPGDRAAVAWRQSVDASRVDMPM